MLWLCSVVAFFSGCTALGSATHRDCVGIPTNISEYLQPIFTSNGSFILPVNGTIRLKERDTVVISCPNSKNFLRNSNKNASVGLCSEGKIKVENGLFDFNELQCNKSIRGDVQPTNKSCGNNEGHLTNIGYYIGSNDFLTLIEICYDASKGDSLYASHTIHGESIRNASRNNKRPSFSTAGVGNYMGTSVAYKNSFQKSTFSKLLGSSVLADSYITKKSYLARGHLAPDADFLLAAWQFSTYFYVNACPQWQVINGGNWGRVETMVRKFAGHTRRTLRVTTGMHGVLSLADVNGRDAEIYLLANGRLRVPKYIWKMVYDAKKQEAVVIIVLNNPFVQNVTGEDYFCKSICDSAGWKTKNWTSPEKGLVHCCEYGEFVKTVDTVPVVRVRDVLKGPYRN